MGKFSAFNFITLDGYLEGPEKGNISWHNHGKEENEFASKSLQSGSTLLFGRVTYQMMASYWPTPTAMENDPSIADGMNNAGKIVFSKTMANADWNNTRLIKDNIAEEIKKLKQEAKNNMTLLGSGSIVTQFAEKGLIDEYLIMIDPVIIGSGTSIFKGISHQLNLELINSKTFKSGVILLCYQPKKK
jgi:dihydrofolate reductase